MYCPTLGEFGVSTVQFRLIKNQKTRKTLLKAGSLTWLQFEEKDACGKNTGSFCSFDRAGSLTDVNRPNLK